MRYRAAKGMNDLLPEDVRRWQRLEATFRRVVELHGYAELRTPILEPTELFVRTVGDTTDIVQKEMFTLQHHGDSLTLRPEGTASAARAYLEHSVYAREPISRWYYLGPMFRAERPQRGRYRQFHQGGCEVFGDAGPTSDAEMIDMLCGLCAELGIPGVQVCINSLGGPGTRARYRDALAAFLEPRAAELTETSQRRLKDNPLRILDSKSPEDQAIVAGAPSILELLDGADREHWDELRAALDALGVPYEVEPGLVRGLDYYTRTLFELRASSGNLGAQNAIAGGGRYDAMLADLGGPATPALGFGVGLERMLLAMAEQSATPDATCVIAPLGKAAQREALLFARDLRRAGVRTDLDGRGGSLKSMLRRANGLGARYCLLLGESELAAGTVLVKDLLAHTQTELPRTRAAAELAARLGAAAGEGERAEAARDL